MALPEKSKLKSTVNITWNGGVLFNGYVLLLMAMPSTGGAAWTRVMLKDTAPTLRPPTRVKVPIREGVYSSDTQIWRTDALVPPNVKYSAYFYDSTNRLIATGAALFSVASSQYTLDPPVLTDPTAAVVSPAPQDVPSTLVTNVIVGAPLRKDLVGVKNGVNVTFTIPDLASLSASSIVAVLWNGMVLDEGVGYTRAGLTITMTTPPLVGESLEVLIWSV